MLPSLQRWLNPQSAKKVHMEYFANVRAHLGQFVKGHVVNNEDYMKELYRKSASAWDGRGLWEFRISFEPKARIFGAFAGPDLFFATHPRDRDDLGWNRRKWEHATTRIANEWERLFPGRRWWIGTSFSDYVTFNGDDRHVGRR